MVDRYTKMILTIIAACLVWISIGGLSLITPAQAQTKAAAKKTEPKPEPIQAVYIAGWMDETFGPVSLSGRREFKIPLGIPVTVSPR